MLPFASCVRSRGVSNFPGPSGNGKFPSAQQLGVGSSQLSAAENTCAHLLPAGTNDRFPAGEMPQVLSAMLNFSRDYRLPPQVMTSDGECHHVLPAGGAMPLG